jgi:hypothetical protein
MTPLYLIPISLCILSSCTLSDWSAQTTTPLSPTQTPVVQSGTTDTITNKISATTAETLKNAYSEELLAEAIYRDIVAKYPALASIDNIVQSEGKHSTQVGKLLTARGITLPTDFGIYADTYTTLKTLVDSSLTGAIEVGVMVEVGDIDHLLAEYQTLTDADIRQVFENIGGGSFNHLRAFLRFAEQYSYTPTTDSSKYMTPADLSTTGSLKSKMTDLLKANNLPTSGVSGGGQGQGQGQGQGRGRMNR